MTATPEPIGQTAARRTSLEPFTDRIYASLKVVGKLAAALDVEPAELLKLPPKRGRQVQ
jgi:hypothetical protein